MRALAANWQASELGPRLRAILTYAAKLTLSPSSSTAADVDAFRGAGLDDRAILDVAEITAYFNFVNRLADGLGVQLEA